LFTSGCGGGGGGGGGAPVAAAPVASTSTFQIRAEIANEFNSVSSDQFSISGTLNGQAFTGSGTGVSGSASSVTFEGAPALQKSQTTSFTIVANGVSVPVTTNSVVYVDSNYNPLGKSSSSEYAVLFGAATIPTTAVVNDNGTAYTFNRYANSSKATFLGTEVVTYVLAADTASTALLKVTHTFRNATNTLTSQDTSTTRIMPSGGFTNNSESGFDNTTGLVLNITY
jgi:hypothetical protein